MHISLSSYSWNEPGGIDDLQYVILAKDQGADHTCSLWVKDHFCDNFFLGFIVSVLNFLCSLVTVTGAQNKKKMKNCCQKVGRHLTCVFGLRSLLHVSILML